MDPSQIPLRDIHLPPPVPWWPPALGWWIVAIAIVASAVLLVLWLWRAAANRSRRYGVPLPEDIWHQWRTLRAVSESSGDTGALVRELSEFLRRVALSLRPRPEVAGLTGEAWLAYLDMTLGGEHFRHGPGHVLINAPYQRTHAGDLRACLDLCERWLRAALDQRAARA
jgi:hypothetical protein